MVELLQFFLARLCRPSDPGLLPFLIAFDPQRQTVVLHPVHLFVREAGQAGPQEAEHTVIRKILLRHRQKAPDIFHKCIEQDALLVIHEYRDIIEPARLLQRIRVHIHIRSDHRDVTVAVSFFPYQTADLPCRRLRFLPGAPGLMERHRAFSGMCIRCIPHF